MIRCLFQAIFLTLSWRRSLSYRNQSIGFHMMGASVMKELYISETYSLFQFCGIYMQHPWFCLKGELNVQIHDLSRLVNTFKNYGCISSGSYDLFGFSFSNFLRNISSIRFILKRFTSVFLSRTVPSSFGSFVKTLKICLWRTFAFSFSSNFVKLSSILSCRRGAMPVDF